jgi:hypothetical protein
MLAHVLAELVDRGGRVSLVALDPAAGRAAGASDPRKDGGLAEV